jgi:hypothetical protein
MLALGGAGAAGGALLGGLYGGLSPLQDDDSRLKAILRNALLGGGVAGAGGLGVGALLTNPQRTAKMIPHRAAADRAAAMRLVNDLLSNQGVSESDMALVGTDAPLGPDYTQLMLRAGFKPMLD